MVVLGLMHQGLIGRRGIQEIRQIHPFGVAHQALGDPYRPWRFRSNHRCTFAGTLQQGVMRHYLQHHADL